MLREGYRYLGPCERYGSDVFETRILGRKALCMKGEEATRLLYDEERFTRRKRPPHHA